MITGVLIFIQMNNKGDIMYIINNQTEIVNEWTGDYERNIKLLEKLDGYEEFNGDVVIVGDLLFPKNSEKIPKEYFLQNDEYVKKNEITLFNEDLISEEQFSSWIRNERDRLISDVEWRVTRYQQQVLIGDTTETKEEHESLLRYIQELRDIPQQEDFPASFYGFPKLTE